MSPGNARAFWTHFHNGLGTYYPVRMYVSVCALKLRMDAPLDECILRGLPTIQRGLVSLGSGGSLSKSNDTLHINLGNRRSLRGISQNMMTPRYLKTILQIPMIDRSCKFWYLPLNDFFIAILNITWAFHFSQNWILDMVNLILCRKLRVIFDRHNIHDFDRKMIFTVTAFIQTSKKHYQIF